MINYELILKDEKIYTYGAFAWILIVFNLLTFLALAVILGRVAGIVGAVSFVLCFVVMYAMRRTLIDISRILLLLAVIIWIVAGNYWYAVLSLILGILYFVSTRTKVVRFKETGIEYPSFPTRSLYWNELFNAILKDGLLTIDLKNNRLIQQVVDETKTKVNEQDFNDFCTQQLASTTSRPPKSIDE